MTQAKVPPVWEEPFRVRFYEAGPGGLLGPAGLANYLQEAAALHAQALGVSINRLNEAGLGWGLVRLWLEMARPPRTGQRIKVRTWPSTSGRLALNRDFEVLDEAGNRLARAVSRWVTIDLASRRAARLAEFITAAFVLDTPPCQGFPSKNVAEPDGAGEVRRFMARPGDLDSNGHVNNAHLISWAEAAGPFGPEFRPIELDMAFKAECRQGDEVISLSRKNEDDRAGHRLVRASDGATLAVAASRWAARA